MTGALLTTIRQQLRKRWVRCVVCLCALAVGYVVSAGTVVGLSFHPLVRSLPCHPQINYCAFAFYGPVLAISGSNRCPGVVRDFISLGMRDRRNDIGSELALTASVYYDHMPRMRDGMTQFAMYLDQRELWLPSAYGLDGDVEYFPLNRDTNPRAWSSLARYRNAATVLQGHLADGVTVAPLVDFQVSLLSKVIGFHSSEIEDDFIRETLPTEIELEEPRLALVVGSSSRLGGSLALPGDLHRLPASVLLTFEEIKALPDSEESNGEHQQCFPLRHFPMRPDRSGPFVFTSIIAITR